MKRVFGIDFSPHSSDQLLAALARPAAPHVGARAVVTANLDHVVTLARNEDFRSAYASAWAVTADGMPVYLYARLRGVPVPARVTGSDLFADLMQMLAPEAHRCFFVASSQLTADRLAAYLDARGFPPDAVATVVPPFGFDSDAAYSADLARRISEHRPTHLFFGVGAPKSEIWCHRHRDRIGDCYVLCVGAGLDFFAGTKIRAPRWMQKAGFEWFWRFAQEPRRLFRRYFVHSGLFLGAIARDLAFPQRQDRRSPS